MKHDLLNILKRGKIDRIYPNRTNWCPTGKAYFEQLYAEVAEDKGKKVNEEGSEGTKEPPIIPKEITIELAKRLKKQKTLGLDNISNELLK